MSTFQLHPDLERDSHSVGDFPLSEVRIIDDATYPWFLLVPRVAGLRDPVDLSGDDFDAMWRESRTLGRALMEAFAGEKLNVAALGNMTPQLHIHHVVRYASDPAWPGPIWGKVPMRSYTDAGLASAKRKLTDALGDTLNLT